MSDLVWITEPNVWGLYRVRVSDDPEKVIYALLTGWAPFLEIKKAFTEFGAEVNLQDHHVTGWAGPFPDPVDQGETRR